MQGGRMDQYDRTDNLQAGNKGMYIYVNVVRTDGRGGE